MTNQRTLIALSGLAMLCFCPPVLAHKEDYLDETFVYETIGKGVASLEYRTRLIQENHRREGQQFWTNSPFLEYGMTDHTMVEVTTAWGTDRNFTEFGGAFAQVRHRFGNEGDYPIDPAIGLEYETEREEGELGHFIIPTVVLSKDLGEFNLTYNGFLRRGLDNATSRPWEWQQAVGLRYGRGGVRFGVEVKDLGVERRYVLPELTLPLSHNLTAKIGIGTHLAKRSPDLIAECLIEWEFGENEHKEK